VLAALSLVSANGLPAHPVKAHATASRKAPSHLATSKAHPAATHKPRQSHSAAPVRGQSTAKNRLAAGKPRPATPTHRAVSRRRAGRSASMTPAAKRTVSLARMPMPPPLRGSHDSLARQNDKTEADNLERIQDDKDLADRIARGMLVPLPTSQKLTVNQDLPADRRYCRPWTASFLSDLARAHAAVFHSPLEVTSAVRTVEYQKRLIGINGNAAAAEGDIVSPHVTGATIDLAKQGLSRQQLGWLRHWLLLLQKAGKIDVEEEFQQSCFHITVYKSYVPSAPDPLQGSVDLLIRPSKPSLNRN